MSVAPSMPVLQPADDELAEAGDPGAEARQTGICAACPGVLLQGEHCLAHLTSEEFHEAVGRLREGAPLDARNVEVGADRMAELLEALMVDDIPRIARADFRDATFRDDLAIIDATFTGEARFDRATFGGDVVFETVIFEDDAVFDDAVFQRDAVVYGSSFVGHSLFCGSEFRGDARFDMTTFAAHAVFDGARFCGRAAFEGARFRTKAIFDDATFCQDVVLSAAALARDVTFRPAIVRCGRDPWACAPAGACG